MVTSEVSPWSSAPRPRPQRPSDSESERGLDIRTMAVRRGAANARRVGFALRATLWVLQFRRANAAETARKSLRAIWLVLLGHVFFYGASLHRLTQGETSVLLVHLAILQRVTVLLFP